MTCAIVMAAVGAASPRRAALEAFLGRNGIHIRPTSAAIAAEDCPVLAVWEDDRASFPAGVRAGLADLAYGGRLISVMLGNHPPSHDIPAHPVIDLSAWRGGARNRSAQRLLHELRRLAGEHSSLLTRLLRRTRARPVIGGLSILGLALLGYGAVMNVLSAQNNVCSIGFAQPNLSDICGYLGLGEKPTRRERLAWEGREAGSCEALRQHIRAFPEGAYLGSANALLDAAQTTPGEQWRDDVQQLALYVMSGSGLQAGEAAAMDDALERGQDDARRQCMVFDGSDHYRLKSSRAEVAAWDCQPSGGGVACGFSGLAICEMERRILVNSESCGP